MIKKLARLALIVISVTAATNARAETLTDALISAYKNSGLLEQNRALLRSADEGVAQSVARLRPVLNYALDSNYSSIFDRTTTNFQLSAQMMLYDFGSSKLRIDVAKENVLALREALIGVEQSVLLRAVSAYVNVQRDLSIKGLRENNVRLISQQLQASKDRFEVGEITRTDVALSEARLAAARSALAAANGLLAISREEFRAAIGHYPGRLKGLPRAPATAKTLDGARLIARQNHPDIAQAKRSVSVADLNVAVSAAAILPTLRGRASGTIDRDGNTSSSVGLTLSGPIYQGGALASAQRQAAAQRDASRAGLLLAVQRTEQNVGNAWAQLAVANASLAASEQQIRASRVAYRGVKEEAALGARTTLDALNAEQELLDAESRRISSQTDRYVAVYRLLGAMGLLTAEHLGLGLVTYDPAAYYNSVKNAPTRGVSDQGKRLDSLLKSIGQN